MHKIYYLLGGIFLLVTLLPGCNSETDKKAKVRHVTKESRVSDSGWITYEGNGFAVDLPEAWFNTVDREAASWSALSSMNGGKLLASFYTPADYLEGTNFGYIQITIGKNKTSDAVKNCLKPVEGRRVDRKKMKIDSLVFTRVHTLDAATGDRYAVNSYRIIQNKACWAVESVLNYSPIEFYGKQSGVKTFDRQDVEKRITKIIYSFKFLNTQHETNNRNIKY